MIIETPPPLDIYEECLKSILSFYDVHVDIEGLLHSVPREGGVLCYQDIFLIAGKINFTVKKVRADFKNIESLSVPAILILKDDEACIYYPEANTTGRFFFPGKADSNYTVKDIAKLYTGEILIMIPKGERGSIDTSHLKRGHVLDWFWDPISAFWPRYAEVIFCSVFINILALATPLFTLNVYDRVVVNFVEDTLVVLTTGVIAALVFDCLFKLMRSHILERIAARISVQYDFDLMERFLHIKDVDIGLSVGEKANLFRELHSIRDFYAARLVPTMVDIPFFILFTFVIYLISPVLTLIPIFIAVILVVLNMFAQFSMGRSTEKYFTSMQNKSSFLIEMLTGLNTIKILSSAGFRLLKWRQVSENSAESTGYTSMVGSVVAAVSALITQMGYVLVIFFGVYQIDQGYLTIGGLIACSIIFNRALAPVAGFSGVLSRLKQSQDVLNTIDKIFQLPHEDVQSIQKGNKGPFQGAIEIQDLSYKYPDQARPALYKINLKIEASQKIGFIGRTGAGKTTLSKIMAGLISPAEGNIYLDSYSYEAIASTELRRSIGYVPQDAFFFRGTVRENILMGNEAISRSILDAAIELSGLDLVIQQTGEGLDTDVGEQGKKLSGGQKQAVALARAIVRDPEILVFDEPTNGMDNMLEERVKNSLAKFIKGRTFIMITHRTTLLPLVDRLILLDGGRIAADGSREEILRKLSGG